MRVLTTLAALALLAAPLEAQDDRHARRGFWFGLGVGVGSVGPECDTCVLGGRAPGAAGYVILGFTALPNVLVGAELSGWAISTNFGGGRQDQTLASGMVTVHWYPSRTGPYQVERDLVQLGVGITFH